MIDYALVFAALFAREERFSAPRSALFNPVAISHP